MWSGPRNLSTALMYSFAARGDCSVWDEPFYAAYLSATGVDHPMRDQIIAAYDTDPDKIAASCVGPIPENRPIFYQKHMTVHMLPRMGLSFLDDLSNVFLIRHPARVVASYQRKRESPTLADLGFVRQLEIFERAADLLGVAPPVLDSSDIRSDPHGTLSRLCRALKIGFTRKMLSWPAGPKPFDGVWAPHWYSTVHASSGFEEPEGPLPVLSGESARLADLALPIYQRLEAYKL